MFSNWILIWWLERCQWEWKLLWEEKTEDSAVQNIKILEINWKVKREREKLGLRSHSFKYILDICNGRFLCWFASSVDFNHIKIKNTTFNFYQACSHECCSYGTGVSASLLYRQIYFEKPTGNWKLRCNWRRSLCAQFWGDILLFLAKFGGHQTYGQKSYSAPGSPLSGCWLVRRRLHAGGVSSGWRE